MIEEEYQKVIDSLGARQAKSFVALAKCAKQAVAKNPQLTIRILQQVKVLQSEHKVMLLKRLLGKNIDLFVDGEIDSNGQAKRRYEELKGCFESYQIENYIFLSRQVVLISEKDPQVALLLLVDIENLQKKQEMAIKRKKKRRVAEREIRATNVEHKQTEKQNLKKNKKRPIYTSVFSWLVLFPVACFAIYQMFIATPRYESQAQVIVQQPDAVATMDAGMALLSGMGVSPGNSDTELIKAYIYSNDMMHYLNEKLDLLGHYSQSKIDYFSRMHANATREELLEYYYQRVKVDVNEKSGVITIYAQGFDSGYAQQLAQVIVKRAEWYLNSIGHQLAIAQLTFIQGEHDTIEKQFAEAQTNLLNFQQRYNLLDPTAEGIAMQQITYALEGKIATKQTELKITKSIMSVQAPLVIAINNELTALKAQLRSERQKLSQTGSENIPVSEVLSNFIDYKVKMELALQAYTSSQISLEKSRIGAYRQIKYLIVVETPTLSESNKYPQTLYNITLFFVINISIFAIGRIVLSVINELK